MPRRLSLRPDLAGLDAAARADTILCPTLRPGPLGEVAALLPLHDPNAQLLAALGRAEPGPPPMAAVFAADPFQRPADLAERLASAGIRAVTGYPSVQLHDGDFARALDAAGHGLGAEVRLLAALAASGLAVTALVASEAAAAALLEAGLDRLAVHPGPVVRGRQASAAESARALAASLRPRCSEVWLHRPHGYGAVLDPAAALCDGVIDPP